MDWSHRSRAPNVSRRLRKQPTELPHNPGGFDALTQQIRLHMDKGLGRAPRVPKYSRQVGCREVRGNRRESYHRSQLPEKRTHAAINALVVAWATTASPILPRHISTPAYSKPATVPANQRSPCMTPNADDETRKAKRENCRKLTDSKFEEISRRNRKPRNTSPSAIGTVTTAPTVRNASHAIRAGAGADASAGPMALLPWVPRTRSRPIQITNTILPVSGAAQPNFHSSAAYLCRKTHKAAAAAK